MGSYVANLKQGVIYFIKQACGNEIMPSVYLLTLSYVLYIIKKPPLLFSGVKKYILRWDNYPVKVDRKHTNIATFNKRFRLKEKYFHINTRLTKLLISYVSFLYPIAFIQYYANIWNRVRESFLLHDVHYYMYLHTTFFWSYSFHKNHGFYIHIR